MPSPHALADPFSDEVGYRFRALPLVLTLAAASLVACVPIPGLSAQAQLTLVILVVAGGSWMTESLPVAVTALLIPVLGVALGVTDAKGAFAGFGDPIVFLFFGTFLLTEAAQLHGLNDRLARRVLSADWVKASPTRLLWAVAILGCAISAWVNNTATTALLLPLALTARRFGSKPLLTGVLLAAAYGPSLGGLATPVGTAPNLIGLRLLEEATGSRPSFAQWCLVFMPLALVATAGSTGWLALRARRHGVPVGDAPLSALTSQASPGSSLEPADDSGSGRAWSLAERSLLPVFVIVVALWITPGILAATPLGAAGWVKLWQQRLPEPVVPLLGALVLFVLPARRGGRERILDASVLRLVDWNTLLLFGGGLSLGAMMFDSGLARTLGEGIFSAMPLEGTFGVVLAAAAMAVLVSEMTSNTASAALVVPVVLALAQAAGIDPTKPALAATVACSFGFMLPVSTPPNALVYATREIPIRSMIANGALLDVAGVLLVAVWVTLAG